MATPTSLYRLYNAEGTLLYVGISGHPGRRMEQHRKGKRWWSQVAGSTIEHYDSRSEALAAERAAIQRENPPRNRVHSLILEGDRLDDDEEPHVAYGTDPIAVGWDLYEVGVSLEKACELAESWYLPVDVVAHGWNDRHDRAVR